MVELSLCIPQGNVRQLSEIKAEAVHSTLHVVQPKQFMSSKRWKILLINQLNFWNLWNKLYLTLSPIGMIRSLEPVLRIRTKIPLFTQIRICIRLYSWCGSGSSLAFFNADPFPYPHQRDTYESATLDYGQTLHGSRVSLHGPIVAHHRSRVSLHPPWPHSGSPQIQG